MNLVKGWGYVTACLTRNTVTVHTAREAEAIATMFGEAAEHLAQHERNEAQRLDRAVGRAVNAAFATVNELPPGRRVCASVPLEDDPPLDVA